MSLVTCTHTCFIRHSSWYTGSVCTASRRWCYRVVMETNMQKWHNWQIHGDVLWCGWYFWRRTFDNRRDKETDWKITCRKNVRVSGKLFSFRSLCFTEYERETGWPTVDLFNAYGPTSSSSSSSSSSPSLSPFLGTHVFLAKVWNHNIPAWQISAYQLS